MGVLLPNAFGKQKLPDSFPEDCELPTPPQQAAVWTPPPGASPKKLVSAATMLFHQGLADPRGCEYREIELLCHREHYLPSHELLATRGWVLPGPPQGQRFVIAWNGLVCPVTKVGPTADVRKDTLALIAEDEAERAKFTKDNPGAPFTRQSPPGPDAILPHDVADELEAFSHKTLRPMKACVLLRMGHGDLAARLWNAWKIGTPYADPEHADADPYPMLANEWTGSLLDRAATAHSRGEDRMALSMVRKLTAAAPAVAAESSRADQTIEVPPVARALLADQERRLALRKAGKIPPAWICWQSDDSDRRRMTKRNLAEHLKHFPEKPRRISELIDLLEYGDWYTASIFTEALAAEGNDAMEPLLACLMHDRRLSRSVLDLEIDSAAAMALKAIEEIMKTSFSTREDIADSSSAGAQARKALIDEIRAYWRTYGDMPLAERWYRILSDDKASVDDWLAMARNITCPGKPSTPVDRMDLATEHPWPKRDQRPSLHGDPLRDNRKPSVVEVMARRVEELSTRKQTAADRLWTPLERAGEMAMLLARWDPEAAVPTLQRQTKRCHDAIAARDPKSHGFRKAAEYIAEFTVVRTLAGDRRALDEYSAWIRGTTPESFSGEVMVMLEPLWRFPKEKPLQDAAAWLFGDPASPWNPLGRMKWHCNCQDGEMIHSPLITLPAFQQLLLRLLADKTVTGTATAVGDGITIEANGKFPLLWRHSSLSYFWDSKDPRWPPYGTEMPIRTCDVVACHLAEIEPMPQFGPCWPEADRDRVIATCADMLRRYGPCLKLPQFVSPPFNPEFELPPLDHPATAEDVHEGRAIFSLEDEGETRILRSIRLPQTARWTAYKKGSSRWAEWRLQTGKLVQVEEVRRGGKWQRYFGFAGLIGIHKVPAEEIEFRTLNCWKPLDDALDVGFFWQGTEHTKAYVKFIPPAVGNPMGVCLSLMNRKGADRAVPRFFDAGAAKPPGGGVAVRVCMSCVPDDDLCAECGVTPELLKAASKLTWTDLKPRRTEPLPLAAAGGKTLGPAETTELVEFDIAQWFPIEKPGTYHLRVEFEAPGKSFEPVELFMPVVHK
jgi:hypothetical protein